MLSRNSSGDWLQDDGTYSSTVSTTWVYRQPDPDSSSNTATVRVADDFTAQVGQEGLVGSSTGTGLSDFALPTFTYEVDTVS